MTVKLFALVAVPPFVVTVIVPVLPFAGTVAVIFVAEPAANVAVTPSNLTAVTPVSVLPVIVPFTPALPLVGVNLAIEGFAAAASAEPAITATTAIDNAMLKTPFNATRIGISFRMAFLRPTRPTLERGG